MNNQNKTFNDYIPVASSSDRFASFFVFLFWPLLGTILSFRYYKFKNSANVIWLFNIFVGLSFSFAEGSDSNRYRDDLKVLHTKTSYTFEEFWNYVTGEESNTIDFIQPTINFLVSRITDNEFFLYGIYGLVFGFFYSRNIWFLINKIKNKVKIEALAFLVLFAFLVPFWSINGFRYWTATHVFFYGLINFYSGKKWGIFFLISSLFVHYTYVFGLIIFFIHYFLGNQIRIFFVIYIISIFLTFLNLGVASEYIEKISSEKVKKRASTYVNEETAETYFDSQNNYVWYMKYRYDFIKIIVAGSYFWIFFKRLKLIKQNPLMLKLFCIGLLFMAFANVTTSIPSMLRFFYIGFMSVTAMLFLFFQLLNFKRRPDWYKIITVVFVFLFCLVEFRVGFDNMTLATILGNPFTVGLFDKTIPIINFIK